MSKEDIISKIIEEITNLKAGEKFCLNKYFEKYNITNNKEKFEYNKQLKSLLSDKISFFANKKNL